MTIKLPNADVYHVGLHKTGSTFLSSHVFPLFDDESVRQHDHTMYGNFYEWLVSGHPHVLFANNYISGEPDRSNCDGLAGIHAINPKAKIIISIRSQTTMLRSIYWLCVKTGDARSFEQFVADIIANGKLDYDTLVESYRKVFGKANVLVLLFEELTGTPQTTVERLARFFGVPAPAPASQKPQPVKVTPGDLEIDIRRRLNVRATRRGHGRPHLANGVVGQAIIVASRWGDAAYKRMTDRRMNLLRLNDQDRRLREAYGESNRRLFASLCDTPYARRYPGLEQGIAAADDRAVLVEQGSNS